MVNQDADAAHLDLQLRCLYEDAVRAPGFAFRGAALPVVADALSALVPLVSPGLGDRIRDVLAAMRDSAEVPTETLAEVIGLAFLERFLDAP
ncbi:MAG: hypothetical protein ACK5MT_09695 [Actinomycetales bacterium]